MPYPPITPLPSPPSRQDPTNFANEADAFLGALPDFQSEVNAAGTYIDGKAAEVDADAVAAAASASAASTSATNAANSATAAANSAANAGAVLWVSGSTYEIGDVVYSPINYKNYRAITNHTGVSTDPSLDTTNWLSLTGATTLSDLGVTASAAELNYVDGVTSAIQTQLNAKQDEFPTSIITGNTNAVVNTHYYLNGSAITLTLPATPSVGDEVRLSEVAGNVNCIVARNGSNIMSLAENMTIDKAYAVLFFRYVNATIGWSFS